MKRTIGQRWLEVQKRADEAFLGKFPKATITKSEKFCMSIYKKLIRDLSEVINQKFSENNCEAIAPSKTIKTELVGGSVHVYYSEKKIGQPVVLSNVRDEKDFERLFKIILRNIDEELRLDKLEFHGDGIWEISFNLA